MNQDQAGIAALLTGGFALLIWAVVFVFWLWMLIDCIKNETDGTQRIIWALVIFFLPCIGSLIYLFARKRAARLLRQRSDGFLPGFVTSQFRFAAPRAVD